MIVIREVHEDLIAAAKAFLAQRPEFGFRQDWEGLFNYPWKLKGYPYGYAAMDGDKMVGFVGSIYSEREIAGQNRPYCNLSTWVVDAEYRSMLLGLRMLRPIFDTKDVFISSLTPSDSSRDISEKMGFKALESEQITIPILPLPTLSFGGKSDYSVSFAAAEIRNDLSDEHRAILDDHSSLACTHFLIRERNSGGYCYGVGTSFQVRRLRYFGARWLNLCYLSDANLFVRSFRQAKPEFWRQERFLLLRYDARLIPGKLSAIELKDKRARQFRSKESIFCSVDNLYSEIVTFNKY
jgi:acetoacetyl-CoA synthetase